MVAEHKIDRQKLISGHNPVLTEIATDSPLTVGNGELAFTADITGMQTLYEEYQELPLCTMSQWGWHTKPVSREKYNYTLDDLVMTEYVNREGRLLKYPQDKKVGNEDVYNWLRENPHRLNLVRVRLQWEEESILQKISPGCGRNWFCMKGFCTVNSRYGTMPAECGPPATMKGETSWPFLWRARH